MKKIKLNPGRYHLARENDGVGDSGNWLVALNPKTGKLTPNEIIVGESVLCGSAYARTMQAQDFWATTPVKKILKVNKEKTKIVFETKNSTYTLKVV